MVVAATETAGEDIPEDITGIITSAGIIITILIIMKKRVKKQKTTKKLVKLICI